MRMPVMSFAVVTKGPEATAGSTPKRLKMMGTRVPMSEATTMATAMARPTASPRVGLPCQSSAIAPRVKPQTKAMTRPTLTSLKTVRPNLCRSKSPVARPLTVIVDDWIPTLQVGNCELYPLIHTLLDFTLAQYFGLGHVDTGSGQTK
jgi:hypothetical protein